MPTVNLDYLAPALTAVHPDWLAFFQQADIAAQLKQIDTALTEKAQSGEVIYPPRHAIFNALHYCAPSEVKILILGQDPYHGAGEAMGLAFSVNDGIRIPPSLRNIFKELHQDLQRTTPTNGNLAHWAEQGVLLLNSVMTVQQDNAGSHQRIGWHVFSDRLIAELDKISKACVFMLWGNWARSKSPLIDQNRHLVLQTVHPSPLSASRGFLGCKHFSSANTWLVSRQLKPIDW